MTLHEQFKSEAKRYLLGMNAEKIAKVNNFENFSAWARHHVDQSLMNQIDPNNDEHIKFLNSYVEEIKVREGALTFPHETHYRQAVERSKIVQEVCRECYDELTSNQPIQE